MKIALVLFLALSAAHTLAQPDEVHKKFSTSKVILTLVDMIR
jgi:hypothetical protein